MRRQITALALTAVTLLYGVGRPAPVGAGTLPKELAPLTFLLGDWEGGGAGTPGQGSGGTSFAAGLQDRVIIRTNFANVAATATAPASRHDDLMVIYVNDRSAVAADYFDNEGHVIRYLVTTSGVGQVTFTSEPVPGAPQYRLTYQAAPDGVVKGSFALAPPGQPGTFSPYLNWSMVKARR
ncbi:MAG TPA: hypothetical protein VGK32_23695 [Vicinamibacterales bacterium]|jgi:hypothetical protein